MRLFLVITAKKDYNNHYMLYEPKSQEHRHNQLLHGSTEANGFLEAQRKMQK
jgi:hypothetical protein